MLNKVSQFIKEVVNGQKIQVAGKTAAWKKMSQLKPGMKVAAAGKEPAVGQAVVWDEVVSVRKLGRKQVWDIEIEGSHNFVANGIVAHNTLFGGAAEVDTGTADGVAFTIDQDDVDQTALDLDVNNTAGDVFNLDWGASTNITAALTGMDLDFSSLNGDGVNALYGLRINSLESLTGSTEYGLFLAGTNWDKALYSQGDIGLADSADFYLGTGNDLQLYHDGTNSFITNNTGNLYIGDAAADHLILQNNGGKVGIGTTNPAAKLEVKTSTANLTGQSALIVNQMEAEDILTASASAVPKFVVDNSGNTFVGALATASTTAVCYQSATKGGATVYQLTNCDGAPADLAEYYPVASVPSEKSGLPQAGEIVRIGDPLAYGEAKAFLVERASQAYDRKMIGVVSSKAFQIMGEDVLEWTDEAVAVGLVGRLPVKIASSSAAIEPGDFLTSSDEPGRAMKAEADGYVIGKALERWSCRPDEKEVECPETIMVYLNQSVNLDHRLAQAADQPATQSAEQKELSFDQNLVLYHDLNVLGKTTVSDLGVTGDISAGLISLQSLEGSLNALGSDLKLQNLLGAGRVDIFAGKIVMTPEGDLQVQGAVSAQTLEAEQFAVKGSQSAGLAVLPQGETSVIIESEALSAEALIFVTPLKVPIAAAAAKVGKHQFEIRIASPQSQDLEFNWWLVEKK